jgi:hypothetical protein
LWSAVAKTPALDLGRAVLRVSINVLPPRSAIL